MNKAVVKKTQSFREFLIGRADKIKEGMARGADLQRIIKVAVQAYATDSKLQNCTIESLYAAVCNAAQLGLDPCGLLGSAYLVPFKTTAQLIVGYRGLIDLARRSGQILSIEAHVIHENDKFVCRYGLDAKLEHEPSWDGEPGAVKGAYAIARLVGDAVQWEVMTRKEIDGIRARSQAKNSGPWVTDYEEMAKKTVVRRLCKYLPLTTEMADALSTIDRLDMGDMGVIDAGEAEVVSSEPSRTEEVKKKLAAKGKGKKAEPKHELADAEPPEPEATTHDFNRESAENEICDFVESASEDEKAVFHSRCEGVGVEPSKWIKGGDAQVEALLNTVRDLMAARE